jgi:hypothetical protein
MVEVVLPLLLVNVSIFFQEIVDDGIQPHQLLLSVSRNYNVPLCDFEGYLPELHTKLSPTLHKMYSISITKTIWIKVLMEMRAIRCNNEVINVNIV